MRKEPAVAVFVGVALAVGVACNSLVGLPSNFDGASNDSGIFAPDSGSGVNASLPPSPDSGVSLPPVADGGSPSPDGATPNDGAADAPVCNGVDLTSSTNNCGACGHDCHGARCSAGLCEIVPIAGSPLEERGLWSLYGLTLFNGYLYGTDWYRAFSAVYAVAPYVSVTQPQSILSYDAGCSATAITNDGSQVFFAIYQDETQPIPNARSGVYALDVSGNATLIYAGGHVDQMAADDAYLYWSDHGDYVYSAKKDGTQLQSLLTTTEASHVVAAGGFVYFATNDTLVRAVATDLAHFTVVSDVGTPTVFDVGASTVYWFDATANRLHARPVSLLAPSVDVTPDGGLAPPAADAPLKLSVGAPDSANLYLLTTSIQSGEIYRLKANGSAPAQLLLQPNDGVYAMTQNDTTLFFTTYGSGSITQPPFAAVWRVEKPAL